MRFIKNTNKKRARKGLPIKGTEMKIRVRTSVAIDTWFDTDTVSEEISPENHLEEAACQVAERLEELLDTTEFKYIEEIRDPKVYDESGKQIY